MNWLCRVLLWLVVITGCAEQDYLTPEDIIEVPVVLYFPNEELRVKYEPDLLKSIDHANVIYAKAAVAFYVDEVIVIAYDTEYNHKRDAPKFDVLADRLPIFLVEEIKYDKGSWAGLAWRTSPCKRFNIIAYPIDRKAVVAHELGHTFGLNHAESKTNVMYPTVPYIETVEDITNKQARKVRENVEEYLDVCDTPIDPPEDPPPPPPVIQS